MSNELVEAEPFRADGSYRECEFCYESCCDDIWSDREWRKFYTTTDEIDVCEHCVSKLEACAKPKRMTLKEFLAYVAGPGWRLEDGVLIDANDCCPLQNVADYMDLLVRYDEESLRSGGECGDAIGLPDELSIAIMAAADNRPGDATSHPDNIAELRKILLRTCECPLT